jgi:proteasome assembly chaperone (PAC2) family protein
MADKNSPSPFLTWKREIPELNDPVLIMGFHGWPNAGSVSSDTLDYLTEKLKPTLIATLDEEEFLNYGSDRPIAEIEDGIIHEFDPCVSELTYWNNSDGGHDLILFLGKEPSFRWNVYSSIFIDVMHKLHVRKLFTIGGVQDTVSHSSVAFVTVVGTSISAVEETAKLGYGVRPAEYYGPVSIHSRLVKACSEAGTDALSFWGHVPAYLQKSPRLVARIIGILNRLLGMRCPLDDLERKSAELDQKIDEALAKDPNLQEFVQSLETSKPRTLRGDDKIIRLNDFVKRDHARDPDD